MGPAAACIFTFDTMPLNVILLEVGGDSIGFKVELWLGDCCDDEFKVELLLGDCCDDDDVAGERTGGGLFLTYWRNTLLKSSDAMNLSIIALTSLSTVNSFCSEF